MHGNLKPISKLWSTSPAFPVVIKVAGRLSKAFAGLVVTTSTSLSMTYLLLPLSVLSVVKS